MTDNENLDEAEGKDLNNYQRQRLKYQEKIDAKDARIAELEARIVADKKAYFKNTLASQGLQGNFDEFADKYADKLELDEMVALYKGNFGGTPTITAETPRVEESQETFTYGPKSVIGTNPIGGEQIRDFSQLSLEEMKEWGRSNPQIFQE